MPCIRDPCKVTLPGTNLSVLSRIIPLSPRRFIPLRTLADFSQTKLTQAKPRRAAESAISRPASPDRPSTFTEQTNGLLPRASLMSLSLMLSMFFARGRIFAPCQTRIIRACIVALMLLSCSFLLIQSSLCSIVTGPMLSGGMPEICRNVVPKAYSEGPKFESRLEISFSSRARTFAAEVSTGSENLTCIKAGPIADRTQLRHSSSRTFFTSWGFSLFKTCASREISSSITLFI